MADNTDNSKNSQTTSVANLTGHGGNNINHVVDSTTTKVDTRDSEVDSILSVNASHAKEVYRPDDPFHEFDYDNFDVSSFSLPPPLYTLLENPAFWTEVSTKRYFHKYCRTQSITNATQGTPNLLEIVPQPPSKCGHDGPESAKSRHTIFILEDPYSHILPLPRPPPRAAKFAVQNGASATLSFAAIHEVDLERGYAGFRPVYAVPSGTRVRGRFAGLRAFVIFVMITIAVALCTWAGIMFG